MSNPFKSTLTGLFELSDVDLHIVPGDVEIEANFGEHDTVWISFTRRDGHSVSIFFRSKEDAAALLAAAGKVFERFVEDSWGASTITTGDLREDTRPDRFDHV